MKYLRLVGLSVLMIFILIGCGKKASDYYEIVDEAISAYDEYLDYQESVENNTVLSSDEERDAEYKVVIMQIDAFNKIDEIKNAYDELSDAEKKDLENYILTAQNSKYSVLVDWLQGTITIDSDLEKAINEGENSSQNNNSSANYSDSIQLSSGNYTVPDDILAGTYDVFYVSGIVPSVDVENNGDDDLYECFSESNKSFSNLTLSDGAKIKIESGTVEFRKKK